MLCRVNGQRMNFTQNAVNCVVKIQRTWRLSFRDRTTEKMVLAMVKTNCSNRVLENIKRWGVLVSFLYFLFTDGWISQS